MNLDSMTIEQLAELRNRVTTALSDKVAARQKELLAEAERVGSILQAQPMARAARTKRPVKYRDGNLEWSGCGSPPAWVKAKGDTLESCRV
jgi:DNA-binding protein H-NS